MDQLSEEKRLSVLVVDDEPTIRDSLTRLIEAIFPNLSVDTASDGFQAMVKIDRSKPNLVIMDIVMPELDGLDVIRRVRGNPGLGHTKIIAISAFTENETRSLTEAGADAFFNKGDSMSRFLDMLSEILPKLISAPAPSSNRIAPYLRPVVRGMHEGDISSVVRIHKEGMPGDFLPALGDRVLTRLYELASPYTYVSDRGGSVAGFIVFTEHAQSRWLHGELRRQCFFRILAKSLSRFSLFQKSVELAFHRDFARPGHEIFLIASATHARGLGVGSALIRHCERLHNPRTVWVKVALDNPPALQFYLKHEFKKSSELRLNGRNWLWLKKERDGETPTDGR